jgi:hypothetical protein
MLNDRLKIARRAAFPDVMLGRQVLINCAPKKLDNGSGVVVGFNGCDGGDERDIYESLLNRSNWLPDETCQPYEALNHTCDAMHTCTNCMPNGDGTSNCFEVPSYVRYGISKWTQVTDPEMSQHAREAAMQKEILHHGPIVCNFAAISEFDENYTAVARQHGGVYRNLYRNVTQDDINHDVSSVEDWEDTHVSAEWRGLVPNPGPIPIPTPTPHAFPIHTLIPTPIPAP